MKIPYLEIYGLNLSASQHEDTTRYVEVIILEEYIKWKLKTTGVEQIKLTEKEENYLITMEKSP